MELEIVEEKRTYYYRIFFLISIGLIIAFWLLEYKILFITIPFIQFIPFIVSPTFFYNNLGYAKIDLGKIDLNIKGKQHLVFETNDNIKLRLFYDARKLNKWNRKILSKGAVVRFQIEKDEEVYEYRMLLRKRRINDFLKLLEQFYANGIDIKERDSSGAKYFLFDGNLSYNKIQELKQKYKLSW